MQAKQQQCTTRRNKMRVRLREIAAGAGGLALLSTLFMGAPASAATTQTSAAAKSFASTTLKAYSSGEFAHVGALSLGSTALADAQLGYATSSVNSGGLTSALHGDSTNGGLLIQPAQKAGVKAYGSGAGVVADLNASTPSADIIPDFSTQTAPPYNSAIKTDQLTLAQLNALPSDLIGLGGNPTLGALIGSSNANYTASCLIGKPLAYGAGNVAASNLLSETSLPDVGGVVSSLSSALAPLDTLFSALNTLLSTAGLGTIGVPTPSATNNQFLVETNGTTQTLADSYLTPEGGGKWGVSSFESTEPSPIRINLLGLGDITVSITGANLGTDGTTVPSPIRLLATANGGSTGASVSLQDTDLISVSANILGVPLTLMAPTALNSLPAAGYSIPLSLGGASGLLTQALANIPGASGLSTVTGLLGTLTSALPDVSLGNITLGGSTHAIGSTTAAPKVTGGTAASASYDLAQLNLAPSVAGTTTTLADVALGHLESSVNLSNPISCGVPTTSTSSGAGNVATGGSTTISAHADNSSSFATLLACHVSSTTVTEKVSSSTSALTVSDVSSGGRVSDTGRRSATITWTGKTIGSGGLNETAKLNVPKSAAAGSIKTAVSISGSIEGCNNATAANTYKQIANGRLISGTASHTVTVKK
jgi:hypothetical protein